MIRAAAEAAEATDAESAGDDAGVAQLEDMIAYLGVMARRCSFDSPDRAVLEDVRDRLSSYALAARGLDAAGVPAARRDALLERGRREAAAVLLDVLPRVR